MYAGLFGSGRGVNFTPSSQGFPNFNASTFSQKRLLNSSEILS